MTRSACCSNPTSRRLPAAASVLVLLVALSWPLPAAANGAVPWTDLQTELADCTGNASTQVTLTGDIDQTDGTVTVDCVAEIDLDGHDMAVRNVVIEPGGRLTIVDGSGGGGSLAADASSHAQVAGIRTTGAELIVQSGTVTATGGFHSAGIGGGLGGAGGSVSIAGGTVTASSVQHGAGIGGGQGGAGGPVTITGGTVTATGSGHASGIGGGYEGAGGSVRISGGTVTATGIGASAGIGGGISRAGGDVRIDAGAVVTARGGHTAIGAGQGSSSFGSLTVEGTLRLPDGSLRIPAGVVVAVADSGRILGGTDPAVGASILGDGRIDNGGAIALRAPLVMAGNVTVSGHHYRVAFDDGGGSPEPEVVVAFAPTFETGERRFPADPTREDGQMFIGWTDQPDGAGSPFTVASELPGLSTDSTPGLITAFAHWGHAADVATSTVTADPTSIAADGTSTSTITVQTKDANGTNLSLGGATVTLSTTAGTLSETVSDNDDGTYTATLTSAKTAGSATITGELTDTKIHDDVTVTFTAASRPTPTDPGPSDPSPTDPGPSDPTPTDPEAPGDGPEAPVFDDVSEDSVHAAAIDRIVRYGITVGVSETTFDPAGDLARGQMATFLVRLLVLTDPSIERPDDTDAAVALLVDRGLLLGDANGDLDVAGALSRGQAASLLVRLVEQVTGEVLPPSGPRFSDVATTGTHAENIAKLVELGVITGYQDGTYRPGTELRRDQMASLISRALDVLIASGHIENLDA